MQIKQTIAPENTAVRVALWRALHVQVDALPHVLEDEIGLKLVAPDDDWRSRPDMDPQFTRLFRASIVARARFIEDLVVEEAGRGVGQYVILGAGLDTFAQRRPEIASQPEGVRGGPAWSSGVEAPAPDRAAASAFRSGCGWCRSTSRRASHGGSGWWPLDSIEQAGGRGFHRRQHVPHEGGDCGHAAPGRGARSGLYAGDDVPAAAGARWTPRCVRDFRWRRKGRERRGRLSSASLPRRRCWRWRAKPVFETARHVSAADLSQRYLNGGTDGADRTDGLRLGSSEELLVAAT